MASLCANDHTMDAIHGILLAPGLVPKIPPPVPEGRVADRPRSLHRGQRREARSAATIHRYLAERATRPQKDWP
jgi:hypothetical protein